MTAAEVARLIAVDASGLGGAAVRAERAGDADAWAAYLRALLPPEAPARRLPRSVTDDRLVGGLDLAATLAAGRPVAEPGLLAAAHGGVVVVPGAERAERWVVSRLAGALDDGAVALDRHGVRRRLPARVVVVALDEGRADDADDAPTAGVPPTLGDRLAFRVALPLGWAEIDGAPPDPAATAAVARARASLADVELADDQSEALARCAAALGVDSLRALLFAHRAAAAGAALAGRRRPDDADLARAAELVLAPRATQLPADGESAPPPAPPEAAPPPPRDAEPPRDPAPDREPAERGEAGGQPQAEALADVILEAARAAIPAGLLAQLGSATTRAHAAGAAGRAGAVQPARGRGRQVGTRHGDPRGGLRLDLLETLRAAAPWQRLRAAPADAPQLLVRVRRGDFRVRRLVERTGTTTIFVVDASGSAALHRLAETKGAVELMLAESYARRDRVSVIAFRGARAELVLPPTRALARAKRALAGLAGGGGTPLAAGIDAARTAALAAAADGSRAAVVFLTDARANVARDGTGGRAQAEADALDAARRLRAVGAATMVMDSSPRGEPLARRLAAAMGARYEPLPYPESRQVSELARALAAPTAEAGRG